MITVTSAHVCSGHQAGMMQLGSVHSVNRRKLLWIQLVLILPVLWTSLATTTTTTTTTIAQTDSYTITPDTETATITTAASSATTTLADDSWFPAFHVRPASGHNNDPNGPFFFNDLFHLFMQVRKEEKQRKKIISKGKGKRQRQKTNQKKKLLSSRNTYVVMLQSL